MVVKRQKSNTDINGKAVTVTAGGSGSGALIQAVRVSPLPNSCNLPLGRVLNRHEKKAR